MKVSSLARGLCFAAAATTLTFASATIALAETIVVTDIAGRTVEVEKNPSKVIIGEGRMIYSITLLDQDNPFQRVVGWKDDMVNYDPDAYRKYLEVFPDIADLPSFGSPYTHEWNLEAGISIGTEVVLMNLGNLLKAQESGIIEKLDEAGIATIFVDFRQDPTQNTVPSLQLLGRIFDKRAEADAFGDYPPAASLQNRADQGAARIRPGSLRI